MSKNTVKPGLRRRGGWSSARRHHGAGWLLLRFVSGRPLDGRRYSNATFWQRGTRRVGHPPYLITWDWWTLAAGWQRSVLRLSALAVAALVLVVVVIAR